jgi:hypothetical protein
MADNGPCMLCGGPTGDALGLCLPCCRAIKRKQDEFAQDAQKRLAEAKRQDEKATHQSRTLNYAVEIKKPKKDDDAESWWPKGLPL